jgi:monoamine oxidase
LLSPLLLALQRLLQPVLEARDRVGGVTCSPVSKILGSRLDLGGQWASQRHTRISALFAQTWSMYSTGSNASDPSAYRGYMEGALSAGEAAARRVGDRVGRCPEAHPARDRAQLGGVEI